MAATALLQSDIPQLVRLHQGKVRDIYAVDEAHLLVVASDRLSAFDVVFPQPIPGKGEVLTRLANFWFKRTEKLVPNHLSTLTLQTVLNPEQCDALASRAVIVKRLKPLPVEAIVRGYLIGSGWKDYQSSGTVCGIPLPKGLKQADRLPDILYTPSSKAAVGKHDENIDFEQTVDLVGPELANKIRQISLKIYRDAAAYAKRRGIIIADTKFEFGVDAAGKLYLIDEALTPDSSRFWPLDEYQPGSSPPSFDKQFVRDYLETLDWNKAPPAPDLPVAIISKTAQKYAQAARILMRTD